MEKIVRLLSWCFSFLLGVTACTTDEKTWENSGNEEYLSLYLRVSDESSAITRATTEDGDNAQNENMVTTADVFIFENGGNERVHYQRLSNNNNGSTLAGLEQPLSLRKKDVEGKTLDIYVIANYNKEDLANIQTLDELKNKSFEQDFTCNNSANDKENFFLMDGKTLNVTNLDTSTPTIITLRRAAAKIRIKINAGTDKISYTDENGKTHENATIAISSTANLLKKIINYTSATSLLADAGLLNTEKRSFKSSNKYVGFSQNTALLYSYANSWSSEDIVTETDLQHETYVLLNIPVIVTYKDNAVEENKIIYPNYYRVPLGDRNGGTLERNHLYDITAVVNALGSGVENTPVILDSKLQVQDWKEETIDVGSDNANYLEVNKTELLLNNIEKDNSIEFFSSSPVSVEVSNVTYINKYGVTKEITKSGTDYPDGKTYYPTIDEPATLTGALQLHSELLINVPKFFTITITNKSGLSKTIQVTQYPLEYITSTQGWYSTRDDLASWEEYKNDGATVYNISTGEGETRIVYFNFGAKVVTANNDGKSTIYKYNYNKSQKRELGSLQKASDNARIYHVQLTAASSDYRIGYPQMDADGYTAKGEDNAKLVSPSFMIASQLGNTDKTGPEGTDNADIELEVKKHCKYYIEVEGSSTNKVVYNDWRLPTPAELDIIAKFQNNPNSAVNQILVSKEYWSSNGKHQVNGGTSDGTRVRCVRDVKPK